MNTNTSTKLSLTWILTLTIGWTLIQYTGIGVRHLSFYTWGEVFPILWRFAINGILTGALLGLFCGFIFRAWTKHATLWGITTFLGYALGSPLGFLMAVVFSWILARLNGIELLAGSSYFLMMPLIFTMVFSGCLVALSQLPALQRTFFLTWKEKALWLLGSSVSWGIGFIVANIAGGMDYSILVQSMLIGLVVSGFTAGILQILFAVKPTMEGA